MYTSVKKSIDDWLKSIMSQYGISPVNELEVRTDGTLQQFNIYGDKSAMRSGWIIVKDNEFKLVLMGNLNSGINIVCYGSNFDKLSSREWAKSKINSSIPNAILQRNKLKKYRTKPFEVLSPNHSWHYIIGKDKTKAIAAVKMLEVKNA